MANLDLKTHPVDSIQCHKWIAVGDIYLDFMLMDYDHFNFNNKYIVRSGRDGIFCVYRPRRNTRGAWSRTDLIGYIKNYEKLLNFIDLRAPFINLCTDEVVVVDGKIKQKVIIFFPSETEIETIVTCMFLKHYNHRYSITDTLHF